MSVGGRIEMSKLFQSSDMGCYRNLNSLINSIYCHYKNTGKKDYKLIKSEKEERGVGGGGGERDRWREVGR